MTVVLSWIFDLTELHQVVAAVILAAAAGVTAIVIATRIAVSVMLVEFAEDTDQGEAEDR